MLIIYKSYDEDKRLLSERRRSVRAVRQILLSSEPEVLKLPVNAA